MVELRSQFLCRYSASIDWPQQDLGPAHFGRRLIAVVTGGVVEGNRLHGKVLYGGGDWALIDDARDVLRLDARITFETHDGAKIFVSYRGVLRPRAEGGRQRKKGGTTTEEDYRTFYFRTVPIFETGDERYLWLNDIVCVGVGGVTTDGIKYEVFEIL